MEDFINLNQLGEGGKRIAAEAGIAPEIMHVDLPNRRVFMEPMSARVVDELDSSDERFENELLASWQLWKNSTRLPFFTMMGVRSGYS